MFGVAPGGKTALSAFMELTLTFFLVAIPALVVAGISKGGFGSGASFVAAPVLALVIEPQYALAFLLPVFMIMDWTSLKAYWRKWDARNTIALICGGAAGIVVAIAFYSITSADALRVLIGAICVLFVLFEILKKLGWLESPHRPFNRYVAGFAGLVAGFTSFVSHAGGPPAAIHLLSQKLDKTTYQATTVVVFTALNVMKAVPYAFLGIFTRETLLAALYLSPIAIVSALLGVYAHRIVPEKFFFAATYVLLILTGSKLLWGRFDIEVGFRIFM